MAIHPSTLEKRSASSVSATVLKLTPLLLAALLAACATKAQRIGSLSGDPSLAASQNGKARGGVPDATQPSAGNDAMGSQGSNASAEAGVDGSHGAAATSAQDGSAGAREAATSSSGDDMATAGDNAGGDQASSMAGAGKPGATSSTGKDGAAAGRTGNPAAAGPGTSGKTGNASGAGSAASSSGNRAGAVAAGGTPAAASAGTDAEGSDLSSGDSVAALEGSADADTGGRTGTAAGRRGTASATGASAAAGTTDDGTATGGAATAGVEGDSRIAAIDVPSGKLKVDEEYRPQTLGGVLPLVLGVNEEGRFDFDQYALRPEVKAILDELAAKLKTAEYDRLDIIGYTDRIGTSDYNRRLSELRAYSVAQYLISRGVPDNKIHYEGRGDKDPLTQSGQCQGLAREELITCLQKDRRVEIEASIHRKHATVVQ